MKTTSKYKFRLEGQGMILKGEVPTGIARTMADLYLRSKEQDNDTSLAKLQNLRISEASVTEHENLNGYLTPKQFMTQKNPKTDMQRIACLAYYLAHFRETPYFKTKDLTLLNREAAQPHLSNPAAAVRNAATHRYLSPAGGGRKHITSVGEAIVNVLPDLDKVREEIDKLKPARKKYQWRKNKK